MPLLRPVIIFLGLCGLLSCQSADEYDGVCHRAEEQIAQLSGYIRHGELDSITMLAQANSDICFYIFDVDGLVYWSSNRLAIEQSEFHSYDCWDTVSYANAQCLQRWTQVDAYNVLSIIPLEWKMVNQEVLTQSFSYRPLSQQEEPTSWWKQTQTRARVAYLVFVGMFILMVVCGMVGIVHHHGFRKMKLRVKLQYLIITLLVTCFGFMIFVSVRYVRKHYAANQEHNLQQKSEYIQSALQQLYYWDYALSDRNTSSLNVDLRDIAFVYGTDIHVYDMTGYLIGSSTPNLFREGLFSHHLSSAVFFSNAPKQTRYESVDNHQYLCAYIPFLNGSNVQIGYIAVPSFISEVEMAMEVDSFLAKLLPLYLIFLVLTVLVSLYIARRITRPISRLGDTMGHFELGQTSHQIDYPYHDELGELVERYNEMVQELERQTRRLARSEREGAWRTMARQIAHEINNPLTPMKLSLQQLIRLKGSEKFDAAFDKASAMLVEQIDNLSHIAGSFSTFARMPEVKVSQVDVADKLSGAVLLQRNNDAGIPIRYIGPDAGVMALADGEQIQQVFINILKNAIQALAECKDGNIIVMLKEPNDQRVEISISDNGPGIDEGIADKIFMPNFTTKSTGTGLGLAISKNIVEASDGQIRFETSEKGTTFFIYLSKQ